MGRTPGIDWVLSFKAVVVEYMNLLVIKGGGRPTRLLPHAKMLLIPIKLFLSAG